MLCTGTEILIDTDYLPLPPVFSLEITPMISALQKYEWGQCLFSGEPVILLTFPSRKQCVSDGHADKKGEEGRGWRVLSRVGG